MGNEKDPRAGDPPTPTTDAPTENEAANEVARTICDERRGPARNGGGKTKHLVREIKNHVN